MRRAPKTIAFLILLVGLLSGRNILTARCYNARGLHDNTGNYKHALEDFDKAILLHPKFAEGLLTADCLH